VAVETEKLATTLAGRSFDSFSEATANMLEILESQLPGRVVYVAHLDDDSGELRIIDSRGDSSFGLEPGNETPLEESFCIRMAGGRGPRLANRPGEDDAYRDLPVRSELGIGSYLGVPLELGDGQPIGSLCALSHDSDSFSDEDLRLIGAMGRMLAFQLERELRERTLEEATAKLRHLSLTDPLTGVLNRRGFEIVLEREWKLSRRGSVSSLLLVADVDHFKQINDTRGHAEGDRVLARVAGGLAEEVRSTDLVGRLGGDEFAVLLVGAGSDEPDAFIDRLDAGGGAGSPSLSFGWSLLAEAASPEEAIALADELMYRRRAEVRGAAGGRRAPGSA
jgi:diguanylate cyclase (GGDEF)-like protein